MFIESLRTLWQRWSDKYYFNKFFLPSYQQYVCDEDETCVTWKIVNDLPKRGPSLYRTAFASASASIGAQTTSYSAAHPPLLEISKEDKQKENREVYVGGKTHTHRCNPTPGPVGSCLSLDEDFRFNTLLKPLAHYYYYDRLYIARSE